VTCDDPADPTTWHRAFGERMRRAREILGIGEAEAAAACLITLRTYRRWEAGLRFYNHWLGLPSFALKYNVSLDWLYAGTGNGPRPRLRLATVGRQTSCMMTAPGRHRSPGALTCAKLGRFVQGIWSDCIELLFGELRPRTSARGFFRRVPLTRPPLVRPRRPISTSSPQV
jgi:transcriptional regulator with XRE-family HTH domain